ncbi:hypothetical protein [Parasediminibacterium sp. JCM 36343]|uniref:hypothetical protein n=1 Tax=Parasediminibacterium sp. JCM 36343 TaxID=3374279 RepID=UPI00397CB455
MELEELKQYLQNKQPQKEAASKPVESLASLIRTNPKSPINKIKKSLLFEMWFTVTLVIAVGYAISVTHIWSLRTYLIIVLLFGIACLIPLNKSAKKINRLSNTVLPVKENLQEIHDIMKAFVKRYLQFTMGLIPVFFILAFSLGFYEGRTNVVPQYEKYTHYFTSTSQVLVFLVLYIVFLTVGMYYFTKWYLKKLYGKYIEELSFLIGELGE